MCTSARKPVSGNGTHLAMLRQSLSLPQENCLQLRLSVNRSESSGRKESHKPLASSQGNHGAETCFRGCCVPAQLCPSPFSTVLYFKDLHTLLQLVIFSLFLWSLSNNNRFVHRRGPFFSALTAGELALSWPHTLAKFVTVFIIWWKTSCPCMCASLS